MTFAACLHRLRCLLVWLSATALAVAAVLALLPGVRRPLPAAFDVLLVRVAEWALLGCAAWAWAVTTAVVAEAMPGVGSGRPGTRVPGVPPAMRRLVLLACGAAVVSGLAGPAVADDLRLPTAMAQHLAHRFDRLPFPSRLPDAPPGQDAEHRVVLGAADGLTHRGRAAVVVRAGDSLWTIAADRLGSRASDAEIAAEWQRIYAANHHVLGDDPALIEPGQRLRVPQEERHG